MGIVSSHWPGTCANPSCRSIIDHGSGLRSKDLGVVSNRCTYYSVLCSTLPGSLAGRRQVKHSSFPTASNAWASFPKSAKGSPGITPRCSYLGIRGCKVTRMHNNSIRPDRKRHHRFVKHRNETRRKKKKKIRVKTMGVSDKLNSKRRNGATRS